MAAVMTPDQLRAAIGTDIGSSDWFLVDQDRVNRFADVTEDHQFIHVDPEAAAQTPLGGTVAHGFLTLSLLSRLTPPEPPTLDGVVMALNYGFEKVRFLTPVRVGKRVRAHTKLLDATEKAPGRYLLRTEVTVEIEGEESPALVAEWLHMQVVPVAAEA